MQASHVGQASDANFVAQVCVHSLEHVRRLRDLQWLDQDQGPKVKQRITWCQTGRGLMAQWLVLAPTQSKSYQDVHRVQQAQRSATEHPRILLLAPVVLRDLVIFHSIR